VAGTVIKSASAKADEATTERRRAVRSGVFFMAVCLIGIGLTIITISNQHARPFADDCEVRDVADLP
jgi:hypothetical protein